MKELESNVNHKTASTGVLAQVAALLAAILSSACCWLPLLLIALGVSGGTLAATFEAYRPFFLPLTFALLATAFYFTYRKPRANGQETGEACCSVEASEGEAKTCCPADGTQGSTVKRFNKVMLWIVSAFVLAFAFFPDYVGHLLGGQGPLASDADVDTVAVRIDGMTCKACALKIEKSLLGVKGVVWAKVSYEKGEALVGIHKGTQVPRHGILEAIAKAGPYKGHFREQVHWVLKIVGMTCQGCAARVRSSLVRVPGVSQAEVDYEKGTAEVSATSDVSESALCEAVKKAGYSVSSARRVTGQEGGN